MKKLAIFLCGAVMFAGLATPVLAATPASSAPASSGNAIQEGATEVGGLVAWFKSDLYDAGFVVLNVGRMFTDQLELRLSWIAILGDTSGGFISPGADYFFPNRNSNVVPYIGAAYGLGYGDASDLASLDLHAGLKQFLTERLALDYRFQYLQPTDSDFDSIQFFQVGFAYYL